MTRPNDDPARRFLLRSRKQETGTNRGLAIGNYWPLANKHTSPLRPTSPMPCDIGVVVAAFKCVGTAIALIPTLLGHRMDVYVYRHVNSLDMPPCSLPEDTLGQGGRSRGEAYTQTIFPNYGRESSVYLYHLLHHHRAHLFTFFAQEGEIEPLKPFLLSRGFRRRIDGVKFLSAQASLCRGADTDHNGGDHNGEGNTVHNATCLQNFCWLEGDMARHVPEITRAVGWTCPTHNFVCGMRGAFGVHKDAIPPRLAQQLYNVSTSVPPAGGGPLRGCRRTYGAASSYAWQTSRAGYAHALERLWPELFHSSQDALCETSGPVRLWLKDPPRHATFPSMVCRWEKTASIVGLTVRARMTSEVARAVQTPSSCVPDGLVLLSIATLYHLPLRQASLSLFGGSPCFQDRLVSVCYGFDDGIGTCVVANFPVQNSDFLAGSYHHLVWAKWRVIAVALLSAPRALFFDADVVIVSNPFVHVNVAEATRKHDILFQVESGCANCYSYVDAAWHGIRTRFEAECKVNCPINGGLVLVRNASGRRFVQRVLRKQPLVFSRKTPLDQTFIDDMLSSTVGRLPVSFAGRCWMDPRKAAGTADNDTVCRLATFHTQCTYSYKSKQEYINWLVGAVKEKCGQLTS